MILIELNGERQLVDSLDGYDGWAVVAEDACLPPSDHCAFVDGSWVEDEAAKATADQAAALNAMSPADLADMLQAQIDALTVTVDQVAAAVAPAATTASGG